MANENDIKTVKRIGNAQQALVKLSAPPDLAQPNANVGGNSAGAAAPAPAPVNPVRALPAPTITVNAAGEAMTNAQMAERAVLGNTPDVASAARARMTGTPVAPAVAPAPVAPVASLDATAGARMRAAAQERLVQAGVAQGPLPQPGPTPPPPVTAEPVGPVPAARPGTVSRVASRVTRLGAAPTQPGAQGGGLAGGVAATLLGTAPAVAKRSTDDYERRFGLDPKADRSLPAEIAIRGVGALTDLGTNLLDTLAYPVKAVGEAFGAEPAGNVSDIIQRDDNPATAKVWENSPANPDNMEASPFNPYGPGKNAKPTQALDFSNVNKGSATAVRDDRLNIPNGPGAADPNTLSPDAKAALTSNAPGTAVINGRVLTPQEIADAGNRINVVPAGAFGNVPYGVAAAELTGKGAPELGSGPTRGSSGQGFTAADRQLQLQNILSGPDRRVEQAAAAEKSARDSLIGDVRSALRNGKRKTAGRLIELLGATRGEGGARAGSPAAPQRTAAQDELTSIQADSAQAGLESQRSKAAGDQRIAALQDAIVNAKTPQEAEAASNAIALLSGKANDKKTQFIDVPYGNGDKIRLPYNTETNEIILPKGLQGVFTDAQGNTQQRALNQ